MLEGLLASALQGGLVLDAALADSGRQTDSFWKIRETIPEAQRHEGASAKHDVSVPVSRVADFLDVTIADLEAFMPGIRSCAFGHVGDGNIHFNFSRPVTMNDADFLSQVPEIRKRVFDTAVRMKDPSVRNMASVVCGGDDLPVYKPEVMMDLMRTIKAAVDPKEYEPRQGAISRFIFKPSPANRIWRDP